MGRHTIPTKIKELSGNPSKRPLNDDPKVTGKLTQPMTLSAGAAALWKKLVGAMVDRDFKDNRKLVKMTDKFRIDGAVALAMAMGLRMLDRPKLKVNPWEDPNFDPYADPA